jgi:hypothetical protein
MKTLRRCDHRREIDGLASNRWHWPSVRIPIQVQGHAVMLVSKAE